MRPIELTRRVPVLACALAALAGGCAGGGSIDASRDLRAHAAPFSSARVSEEETRRGSELEYVNSNRFGAPRGRQFEDVVPVGARITAVHVAHDDAIRAIWLTFERNGKEYQTPRRGGPEGRVETLKLDGREKIVGLAAYGQPAMRTLEFATNQRVVAVGAPVPPGAAPWYADITQEQKRRHVAVGLIGRADQSLYQIMLRIQVRQD